MTLPDLAVLLIDGKLASASDEAAWVTGQIFNVDGGQIIRS